MNYIESQGNSTCENSAVSSSVSTCNEADVLKLLGIAYLYPYQQLVIANVLDAVTSSDDEIPHAQLVILPTGFGKSVCFQVPALMIRGITIIVYPLKGLIADQARRLSNSPKPVFTVTGDTGQETWNKLKHTVATNPDCIILTNPETLQSSLFLNVIQQKPLCHLVLDEAHCIAEWGDTFRPAYQQVNEFIKNYKPLMISAFTATASPPVLQRIAHTIFEDNAYKLVMATTDRPNIYYKNIQTLNKLKTLKHLVAHCKKPLLIFTKSRTSAEILAHTLRRTFPCETVYFYHAGLTQSEKKQIETWFFSSEQGILTATCAYGMGMDKQNIRTVIHYETPNSMEAYIQEAGRAGRDGDAATAILLTDWQAQNSFTHPELPASTYNPSQAITTLDRSRHAIMQFYAEQNETCRRNLLLISMGNENVPCNNCDVCCNDITPYPPELKLILTVIKKHPYQFTIKKLSHFLKGITNQLLYISGYRTLCNWELTDINLIIEALLTKGLLKEAKGLRNGLMYVPQSPLVHLPPVSESPLEL